MLYAVEIDMVVNLKEALCSVVDGDMVVTSSYECLVVVDVIWFGR